MTPDPRQLIEEIKARSDKATPGPWKVSHKTPGKDFAVVWIGNARDGHWPYDLDRDEDADFIAHARQDIPFLLKRLEEAEKEKEQLKAHYEQAIKDLREVEAEKERLSEAILDIDAHATSAGEDKDGFNQGWYIVTLGALHRALGVVGHTAIKCRYCDPPSHDCGTVLGSLSQLTRHRQEAEQAEARLAEAVELLREIATPIPGAMHPCPDKARDFLARIESDG